MPLSRDDDFYRRQEEARNKLPRNSVEQEEDNMEPLYGTNLPKDGFYPKINHKKSQHHHHHNHHLHNLEEVQYEDQGPENDYPNESIGCSVNQKNGRDLRQKQQQKATQRPKVDSVSSPPPRISPSPQQTRRSVTPSAPIEDNAKRWNKTEFLRDEEREVKERVQKMKPRVGAFIEEELVKSINSLLGVDANSMNGLKIDKEGNAKIPLVISFCGTINEFSNNNINAAKSEFAMDPKILQSLAAKTLLMRKSGSLNRNESMEIMNAAKQAKLVIRGGKYLMCSSEFNFPVVLKMPGVANVTATDYYTPGLYAYPNSNYLKIDTALDTDEPWSSLKEKINSFGVMTPEYIEKNMWKPPPSDDDPEHCVIKKNSKIFEFIKNNTAKYAVPADIDHKRHTYDGDKVKLDYETCALIKSDIEFQYNSLTFIDNITGILVRGDGKEWDDLSDLHGASTADAAHRSDAVYNEPLRATFVLELDVFIRVESNSP